MGFRIFVHAIALVFNHFGQALRISALLYFLPSLAYQGVVVALVMSGSDPLTVLRSPLPILLLIVVAVASLWIAVAWHRYVLLDEMPGAVLPPFKGDRILVYFGNSLLVGLIAFGIALVIFVPLGFLMGGLAQSVRGTGAMIVTLIPTLIAGFVIAIFVYRYSMILPASAVGKPIRLSEAWAATRGASGAIFGLAFLSALAVVALEFLTGLLASVAIWWVVAAWQMLVSWVQLLVGVSIITTLYGHYVEKRPVP